jgi:membrane fusion protein (multidrug efflux system)
VQIGDAPEVELDRHMRTSKSTAMLASLLLATAALYGCTDEAAAPAAEAPRPPSKVGVVVANPEPLPVVSELPGRIAPTRIAEVRPRVGGIVLERIFQQGSDVKEGQPLFRIDPATFQVAVEAADATVARAEAVLMQTRQTSERTRSLVATRTSSQANLESAVALEKQAEADLASAKASLKAAQLNLDYATISAPIGGRIGRALVTEGALVSAGDASSLATIQQLDPIYADFRQPVSELIRLRNALKEGSLEQIAPDVAKASLVMDDGSQYPLPGKLLFSEATVDPTSGQVTLRAEFPNPDGNLLPGMYVRVAIEQGIDASAIAIPTQAIQRDSTGLPQVYVVEEGKVALRSIRANRVIGNRTVVDEGLKVGEKVVADGFQKIGPGAPVEASDWVDPSTKPAEAPPAKPEASADAAKTAGR